VVQPGEILPIVLTWRVSRPAEAGWQTILSLDGLLGGNVATAANATGTREAPVTTWPVNEPVRDMQSLLLPHTLKPGLYRLSLARKLDDGRAADGTLLGLVEVKDFSMTPVPQAVQRQVGGRAGEIELLGYAMEQPFTRTVTLRFHTYWRVGAQPARDGVIFLHVIGPNGEPVAQDDNPPEQGNRSTLSYRPGEGIDSIHRLVIPSDAPGGEYQLYAGIYNKGDLERWPSEQNGAPARDNVLYLGKIALAELPRKSYNVYLPFAIQGH
jgi:hypothetical protein